MKITKIGHCCLIIEEKGTTLLTDPGTYSSGQDTVTGVDAVLITHEHPDHLHVQSLKQVLTNNPNARVITNASVGKILKEEGVAFEVVEDGDSTEINGINIEGHGTLHAEIYKEKGRVQNTGYFIADRLFYPGDDFYNPNKPVDVLALPVAGPWMKISEAITYALEVKPKKAFPVHDGMLSEGRLGPVHRFPAEFLPEAGIEFIALKEGESMEC